jgi:hypothetical protein
MTSVQFSPATNRSCATTGGADPLIDWMSGESLHAKRVESVTGAVGGVVNAVSLSIHVISAGLARTTGLNAKHAIKQVDRLLSNPAFNVWELFAHWVPYVVGAAREIVVALDWTDFDADEHSTVAAQYNDNVLTNNTVLQDIPPVPVLSHPRPARLPLEFQTPLAVL